MKIAIDLTSLADNFSGIERYAAELSVRIVNDSSVQWVLFFKEEIHPIFENVRTYTNVDFKILKSCNRLYFNQIKLCKALKKEKADYYLFLAFPPSIFLNKKNCIIAVHDMVCWDCPKTMTLLSRIYFRVSMKSYMKKCYRIITISQFSKQRILSRFPMVKDKIKIVYCGVNRKFFTENVSKTQEVLIRGKYNLPSKYFLSLSTIEPRKNIRLLLQAYRTLLARQPSVPNLVLAGRNGWLSKDLSKEMQGLRDKVQFTGFIDEEDLPSVYKLSSLFIFPSKYEGFGIPPLEALAAGTPVLSSNAASLPEILGGAAIYFKSNDMESLLEGMQNYPQENNISQIEKRIECAQQYSWDVEAEKLRCLIYEKDR